MEQQQIKKKKRKNSLLIGFNSLTDEEIFLELKDIQSQLKKVFKKHVGEENAISPQELFKEIFQVNPEYIDIFKRKYWWDILKGMLRHLRSEENLFVINKKTKLFVLSNEKECTDFKKIIDRDIESLKSVKIKADKWVRQKKYKNI